MDMQNTINTRPMQPTGRALQPWLVVPALTLLIAACSSDTDYDFEAGKENAAAVAAEASAPQALFNPDPAAPVLPFPNNLFFVGSDDGTLNIPIGDPAAQTLANPQFALNQLDGFSTVAPIVTAVSESLDPDSLRLGETVRVFEVQTPMLPVEGTTAEQRAAARSAVMGSVGEITDPQALSVVEANNQLILLPVEPLKPSTSYLVVLTDGILDKQGMAMQKSLVYGLLQGDDVLENESLEGLRGIIASHSAVLNTQLDIAPENVVLSWVFSTQSTRDVLQAVKDVSTPSTLAMAPAGITTSDAIEALQGKADVYIGAIDLPYYQSTVGDDGNPASALNGFWKNAADNVPGSTDNNDIPDYAPVKTTDVRVPVFMTVPNASAMGGGEMPATGWPVTIFQHGITGNRTLALTIADAMADAGRVVLSIDMPMHGLTDTESPLHAANNALGSTERTLGIDVVTIDPETEAPMPGPDGEPDPSGTHFYNLANLANSRDNLRQAVADLFVLTASIGPEPVAGISLDASNLTYVGHSLGGIVGTTMLSYENRYQAATLAMPGAGISQLLANSENFGPIINAGLASNGVETGSAAYNQFLTAAQTMIDSGDPANHASILADNGTPRVHLIEVIGDQTIPNSVPTAPLSGTEPLIRLLGLEGADASVSDSGAAVRFTAGGHGSILVPSAEPDTAPTSESIATTVEMQRQMAVFAATQGASLPIDNSAGVIQAVE